MAKRMLIDAAHPEEIRVAVLKGNRLEDFDFETATKKQLKGNIYLAKVTRVEPSLQAAFVDYGGNRHGFLAFNEVHPDYYRIPIADREALLKQEREAADRGEGGGAAAEPAEGEEVETVGGDDIEEVGPRRARPPRPYKIQEVTKRRQILLVQVVKEERGNKGAALTTYLSLAGRYCVLMPNTPRGGGVSRKITNVKDRRRLKSILEEFEIPEGMSVIVRTAGMDRSKAEIRRDLEYLMRLWDEIRELTLKSTAPALIYEEANLIKRTIRDLYDRDIDEILVEGEEGYRTAKDFMRMLTPSHAKKIQPYKDDLIPLFHRYQVEGQLDAIYSPSVQLRSGGYIVLGPTEALVSIDVNSGRATKERNIEETALRTNLEAAEEIARQLRLRDLAGLIVIDFIDMEEPRNNAAVERRLKEAMKVDRARIQIGRISPFGLLELSRQRLRPSLIEATMQHCPVCAGMGMVRSIESTALHVLRGIEDEGIRQRSAEIKVTVPLAIALYILNQKRAKLTEIEHRYKFSVLVASDPNLYAPNFVLERIKAATGEAAVAAPVSPESRTALPPSESEEPGADETALPQPAREVEREADEIDEAGEAADEGRAEASVESERRPADDGREEPRRRRRRRRRRRGRGEEGGQRPQPALGAAGAEQPSIAASETMAPPAPSAIEPRGTAGEDGETIIRIGGEERAASGSAELSPGDYADVEGEPRRRRARGRRGGRRRRRGERPGAEPSVENNIAAESGQFYREQSEPQEAALPAFIAGPEEQREESGSGFVESGEAQEEAGDEVQPARPRRRRRPIEPALGEAAEEPGTAPPPTLPAGMPEEAERPEPVPSARANSPAPEPAKQPERERAESPERHD